MRNQTKQERHINLRAELSLDPFLTDEELSLRLNVSIQTIRLDRLELGIPEVRERSRRLASQALSRVQSLSREELIGELIELEPGDRGLSMLTATSEMTFSRQLVVRGHFIFAQANSLAVAVVPAQVAITRDAQVHFQSPVAVGDRLIARATVLQVEGRRYRVQVETRRGAEEIFSGEFVVVALEENEKKNDLRGNIG
jgi:acyl-coenzyme A thioesterase PaaI-like protein